MSAWVWWLVILPAALVLGLVLGRVLFNLTYGRDFKREQEQNR